MAYIGSIDSILFNAIGVSQLSPPLLDGGFSSFNAIGVSQLSPPLLDGGFSSFRGVDVAFSIPIGISESIGYISVITKINNTIASNILVDLFHRETNRIVRSGLSDINGLISFEDLDIGEGISYYAIARTDLEYNAMIYDKLIPAVG